MRSALQARQRTVQLEHVADGDDAFGGVGANEVAIGVCTDPAELVAVQPMRWGVSKMQALLEGIDSKAGVLSAYLSSLRVVLVARASAIYFAPSALRRLPKRLQTGDEARC